MAKAGTLTVRVVSDTAAAEKGIERFGQKVESTGDKISRAGDKMTLFATVPIAAAMGVAARAASDLEQSVGAVESVFGDARRPIEEFGETAAETAGLSKRQVNEMAAVIGASLQGLGFSAEESATQVVNLEKRAADMAATFGGSTEEAIQAVGAALRGERDPIERYGVSIKEADVNARVLALGLDTSTTAAEKKSKAIATLDLLMSQTAKTEGQFAREAGGAAGSMQRARAEIENASAEIGSALLPMVAKAAGGVADLASGFADLPGPVQTAVLALAGTVAAVGPVLKVAGSLTQLSEAAANGSRSAALASGAIKGLGAAAAVVGTLYAVKAGLDALGVSAEGVKVDIAELATLSSEELASDFLEFRDAGVSASAQLEAFEQIVETNIGTAKRLRDELKLQGEDVSALDVILDRHIQANRQVKVDTEAATAAVDGFSTSTTNAQAPTQNLTTKIDEEKAAADRLQAAIDKVKDATDRLIGANLSAEQATLRAEEAHAKVTETLKENGSTLDIHSEKGRANREAITSAADAALAHVEALKEQGASTDEVNFFLSTHVERLKETMRQAGLTEDEINGYIQTLGLTPKNIATVVQLQGVAEAEAALNNLARVRRVQIQAQVTGSRTAGLQLHAGGTFHASRPGGEGLVMLRDGERVSTPTEPAHATIDNADQIGREMARAFASEMRRLQRAG